MGAICGILSPDGAGDSLAAAMDALDACGADGAEWRGTGAGLGVRRPSGAGRARAICTDAGAGLAVAADSRLDNREELCGALGIPHAERAGLADGDLILRAYRRWDGDCPDHLLGDYAFAIWDAKQRVLVCARDHVGARPFYYAVTPERFVFASAVEAVLAVPFVGDGLDEATVAAYLTRVSPTTATRTFFKAVRKLPPGHTLTVGHGSRCTARLRRYWRPERTPRAASAPDAGYGEQFLHIYSQAVKARLPAAGTAGVHLSGGLDSSGVAVLAARELRRQGRPPPLAFSWLPGRDETSPGTAGTSEYDLVDAVCEQEKLTVFHRSPSVEDMVAVLSHDVAYPGVHVHLNEEVVQRCAAERGVEVLLSGWGGDEGVSFDGRGRNAHLLLSGRLGRLLASSRERGANPLKFLADVVLPLVHPRLPGNLRRLLRGEELLHRRWLIDPAFARRVKPLPEPVPRFVGVRRTQLWLLQAGHLAERIEGWAAGGVRHGIEYRYPLLDRRLLEFALSLPPEQFRHGRWSRWLVRRALDPMLPAEVCWNPGKADPARFEPMAAAFAGALPVVRRKLDARMEPPSRARYIDMPRLLERLDTERFRARPQIAPIRAALLLLDF